MATPELMALVKRQIHQIFNDSPLTGVNTPGSDENSMKLIWFDVHVVKCCFKDLSFDTVPIIEIWSLLFLLLKFEGNPLVLSTRSIKNLELNVVKFKIRGGLLGIMLSVNSTDGYCWRESAEDTDSDEDMLLLKI